MNAVLVATAIFAAAAIQEPEGDSREIDGDWQLVSTQVDGKTTDAVDETKQRLANGKLQEIEQPEEKQPANQDAVNDSEAVEIKIRLKSETNPKQVDFVVTNADGKESKCIEGIYRLNGDRLFICFSESNEVICPIIPEGAAAAESPRPCKFDAPGQVTLNLKRIVARKMP